MTAQKENLALDDVWKVPFKIIDVAGIDSLEVDRKRYDRWIMVWDWDGSADRLGASLSDLMIELSAINEILAATGSSPNSFPDKLLKVVGEEYRGEWLGEFFPGGVVANNGASWLSPDSQLGNVKAENVTGWRSISQYSIELLGGLILNGVFRDLKPKPDWVGFYPSSEVLKQKEDAMAYIVLGEDRAVTALSRSYANLVRVETEVELVERILDLGVEKLSVACDDPKAPDEWMEQLDKWKVPDLRWTLGDRARLYGLPLGVTKMTGVRTWQQREGLAEGSMGVMGFGNDRNDRELLMEAEVAVVVNSSGEATQVLLEDLRAEKVNGQVLQVDPENLLELARRIGE